MRGRRLLLPASCIFLLLQSCQFSCSLGEKKNMQPMEKTNSRIYNGIELTAHKIRIDKAYLVFANGERVPADNFVDFSESVKLILLINSGWVVHDGKTLLGAAEKITMEGGDVILDEKDLFANKYPDGISVVDARVIALTATLHLKKETPPTSFKIDFRVWDKDGDGYAEGNYKLFSK